MRVVRILRRFSSIVLLLAAFFLIVSANIAFWVHQTVYNTDNFVDRGMAIFDDPEVQAVVAQDLTNAILERSDLESLIAESLPDRIAFLAGPITNQTRQFLEEAIIRTLQADATARILETALETTHRTLLKVIESEVLSSDGDVLVIDLRPVLEAVVLEIGPGDGRAAERLVEAVDVPEDAGRLVIQDQAAAWAYRIAKYGDDIMVAVVIAAIVVPLLSIAVAINRRNAMLRVGVAAGLAGLVSLALLLPVEEAAASAARNPEAARSVVVILTDPFQASSYYVLALGVVLVVVAFFFGGSRVARAVRGAIRHPRTTAEAVGELARENPVPTRIAGAVVAAAVLVLLPGSQVRALVFAAAILALVLGIVWLSTNDSSAARRTRRFLGETVGPYFSLSGVARFKRDTAGGLLRLAGLGVALIIVLVIDLNLRRLAFVGAGTLVYLATLDWFIERRRAGAAGEPLRLPPPRGNDGRGGEPAGAAAATESDDLPGAIAL